MGRVVMRRAAPAILLAILALSVLLIVPATVSNAAVTDTDVKAIPFEDHIEINAGSSGTFMILIANQLSYVENSQENVRAVSVTFDSPPNTSISVDKKDLLLGDMGVINDKITATIDVDKYATAGIYQISVTLTVKSTSSPFETIEVTSATVELTILSPLSSGDTYNKIMGIFKNPFPDPFSSPIASAIITFILWMIIGALILVAIMPLILLTFARGHTEERGKVKKGLRTLIPLVVLLFSFDNALRVYGTSEAIIGRVEVLFNVFYIALGAVIIWRVYLIFIQYSISRIAKNRRVDENEMDLEPLLRLFGKLFIWVFAVAMILATCGLNLTAIITSAGIISLGITLGAQSILNQFFSGMVLLLSRPFKSGDLVKVGDNKTIYKVSRVNIMNTVFQNWDNEETVIMPNNTVSSSTIMNMTGDGLIYKIILFMNVAYDTDLSLAKSLMEKAATEHPSMITDGSVSAPSTRITAFLDSSIEIRLMGYVYDFNDNGRVGGELREAIFKAFKENGIKIPFPQRDVNLNVVNKEDR